jgi:hypothetical protein
MPPGIYMEMLGTRAWASNSRCRVADDAGAEAERHGATVTQLPDSSLGVPAPGGLLHPVAEGDLGEGDAEPDDLVVRKGKFGRLPVAFGDDDLHRLEPFSSLRIVAVAYADEAVTVL